MPFTLGQRWISDTESNWDLEPLSRWMRELSLYFSHLLVKTVCTHAVIPRDPRDVQPW